MHSTRERDSSVPAASSHIYNTSIMHQTHHQRHLHAASTAHQSVNKPLTVAMHCDEITRLGNILQTQFPLINDIIGGVEGLFSCMSGSSVPANEFCLDQEQTYEQLSTAAYCVLEDIIEASGDFTPEGFVVNEIETEFVSWHFNDYLADASGVYQKLLFDMLKAIHKQPIEIGVYRLDKSPVKHVYYIRFEML